MPALRWRRTRPCSSPSSGRTSCTTARRTIGDVEGAFAEAAHVSRLAFTGNRYLAAPLEPRGCAAEWEPSTESLTFWSSTQSPHLLRRRLALATGIREARIRVIVPDVGGGFGQKIPIHPEEVAVALAARRLGRAIVWLEDRRENLVAAPQAKEQLIRIELALGSERRVPGSQARDPRRRRRLLLQQRQRPDRAVPCGGAHAGRLPAAQPRVRRPGCGDEQGSRRAVPRRRLDAGPLRPGAPDRPGGARARARPRGAAPAQSRAPERVSLRLVHRHDLRLGQLRGVARARARAASTTASFRGRAGGGSGGQAATSAIGVSPYVEPTGLGDARGHASRAGRWRRTTQHASPSSRPARSRSRSERPRRARAIATTFAQLAADVLGGRSGLGVDDRERHGGHADLDRGHAGEPHRRRARRRRAPRGDRGARAPSPDRRAPARGRPGRPRGHRRRHRAEGRAEPVGVPARACRSRVLPPRRPCRGERAGSLRLGLPRSSRDLLERLRRRARRGGRGDGRGARRAARCGRGLRHDDQPADRRRPDPRRRSRKVSEERCSSRSSTTPRASRRPPR